MGLIIDHSQAVQTTRQTTTSATNVDITSVSIADSFFNTGDRYLIVATAQLDTDASADEAGIVTVHGTTEFPTSDQFLEHATGSNPKKMDYFWFTVWTAVASEGIKMQFRTGGVGTTGVDQVVLTAIKLNDFVEGTDWHFVENTTQTILTTSFSTSNNASVTFTPPNVGDDWLVLSNARLTADPAESNQLISRYSRSGEASFSGSDISQEREITGEFHVDTNMGIFNLGSSSNTFTQESRVDETNGLDTRESSSILALNLRRFRNKSSSFDSTGILNLTTTLFGQLIRSVSITPTNTGDVFSLGSWIIDNGTSGGVEGRLQVDNVDSPATQTSDAYERNDGFDGKDQQDVPNQTIINLDTSSHTFDIDGSGASSGMNVLDSALVAFTMESVIETETFTVDARLAVRENFTVDAFIQEQDINFNFTVDGFAQAENSKLFLIDAFLQATFDEDFTVDSRLAVRETFTVDGIPFVPPARLYTVDARLVLTVDEEFDIDSILKGEIEEEFTIDSFVQELNNEKSFIIDGRVTAITSKIFGVDGLTRGEQTKTFTIDSRLKIIVDKDFTVDSRLILKPTADFTLDATLSPRELFTVGAKLKFTIDKDFLIDALPFVPPAILYSVDALIQEQDNDKTFSVDAIPITSASVDFTVDGLLQQLGITEIFEVDARIAQINSEVFDIDSILKATIDKTFAVDTFSQQTGSPKIFTIDSILVGTDFNFTVDSITRARFDTTFDVDARLRGRKDFLIDGLTFKIPSKLYNIDAFILKETDKVFTVDSFVLETIDETTQIDAHVRLVAEETFDVDSIIVDIVKLEIFDVDGLLVIQNTEDFTVDSFILKETDKDFTVNSILTGAGQKPFLVDSLILKTQDKDFTVSSNIRFVNFETFDVDAVIKRLGDNCAIGTIFADNINTNAGWTIVDPGEWKVDLSPNFNQIEVVVMGGSTLTARVNKALGENISSKSEFRFEFKYKNTATAGGNSIGALLMGICDDNLQIDVRPRFGIRCQKSGSQLKFVGEMSTGASGTGTQTTQIDIPNDVDVFIRLEKIGQDIRLNVYSDEARTIHLTGSPTPLKDVSAIGETIYTHVGGSAKRLNVPGGFGFAVSGLLDDILLQTNICTNFSIDSFALATQDEAFTVDAKLVRVKKFTIDAFIKRLGDNCGLGLIFEDRIDSNSGWVVLNGLGVQIRVDGANFPKEIEYDRIGNFFPGKLHKLIDQGQGGIVTLSSLKDIKLEFKYKFISKQLGSNGPIVMGLTDTTTKISVTSRFGVKTRSATGGVNVSGQMQAGSLVETTGILVTNGTTVFARLEKVGSMMRLNLYSDEARTIHHAGSPTPFISVASLSERIYNRVAGSGGDFVGSVLLEDSLVDDIVVFGSICTDFSIDSVLQESVPGEFTVDAKLVFEQKFTIDAVIKALGDIRCAPSFVENVHDDILLTVGNWSDEINNFTGEGWGNQIIFIDGESSVSEEIIGSQQILNGFARIAMKPGGFLPAQASVFKTKYRRKLLSDDGGLGRIRGNNFRLEYDHEIFQGQRGVWIGLNNSGAHPQNDANTATFHVSSGSGQTIFATLSDGVNSVSTPTIANPIGSKVFIVVESLGNTLTLNRYTDAEHTIHATGSPTFVDSSSVNKEQLDMKFIFIGANPKFSGPANATTIGIVDNIKIFAIPCPVAYVDARILQFFGREFTVDAKIVRQITFGIDAKIRGRKDFTVDGLPVKQIFVSVDGSLIAKPLLPSFIDAFIKALNIDKSFSIDAIIIRAETFTINAIFSTEPSDPNFSLVHLQDITPFFNFVELNFIIDARLANEGRFLVDAILKAQKVFTVDSFLTTIPQPVFFSTNHLLDITPLFGIAQPKILPDIDGLIQLQDIDEDFIIDANLILSQTETLDIDSILIQIEKIFTFDIDSILKKLDNDKQFTIDSKVININTETFDFDALTLGRIDIIFDQDAIIKALDVNKQFSIDARTAVQKEITYIVDAIILLKGEDGSCNFFPGTNLLVDTGLEQFTGPVTVSHERNVDQLIGQEVFLNNQQIRKATFLLRASSFPNTITGNSFITGKVWSNVVEGDFSGETEEVVSINIINASEFANFPSPPDLPPGVWTAITFDYGLNAPFLTGNHLVGFQHDVGSGVDDPEGVGVAIPVISNSNVIAGSALFRRDVNSSFPDPDKWNFLVGDQKDMIIQLEVVNGNEIIDGKGNRCPEVDAITAGPPRAKFDIDAIVDDFKQFTWSIDAFIKRLGVNSFCTPAPEQSEKTEITLVNKITTTGGFNGFFPFSGEWYEGQRVDFPFEGLPAFKPKTIQGLMGKSVFAGQPVPFTKIDAVIAIDAVFNGNTETVIEITDSGVRLFDSDIPADPNPFVRTPGLLKVFEFDPDFTPFISNVNAFFGFRTNVAVVAGSGSGVYFADGIDQGDAGEHWRRNIFHPNPISFPWGSPSPTGEDFPFKLTGVFQTQGIQPTPTGSASCVAIDACLDGVPQISFTVDAILSPSDKIFTVDGIALVTPGIPFTLDAILDGIGQERFFLISGILEKEIDKKFNLNAFVGLLDQEKTFTVDVNTKFFDLVAPMTVDALVGLPQSKFVLYDALLKAFNVVKFYSVDALLKDDNKDKTFSIDANIIIVRDQLFSIDGLLIKRDQEVTFQITASLAVTQPPVLFAVDAQILLDNHRWRIDGLIQTTNERERTVDAILTDAIEKEFTIDAIVKDFNVEEQFTIDALIGQDGIQFFTLDGLLSTINTFDFTIDGTIFEANRTVDFTVDSIFIRRDSLEIDAFIQIQNVDSIFAVDSLIGINGKQFTIDGSITGLNTNKNFNIDAKVAFVKEIDFTIGAILIGSIDFTISAFVGEVIVTGIEAESVIRDGSGDIGWESVIGVGDT